MYDEQTDLSVDQALEMLGTAVERRAGPHGFRRSGQPQPDRFDGRFLLFRRDLQEAQLTWDGREQWFTFQFRPEPERPPAVEWTGLLSTRFNGRGIPAGDCNRLLVSLQSKLAAIWPEQPVRP